MDSNTIITIVIAVAGLAFALFALNRSRASSGTPKARPAEAPAMPAPAAAPKVMQIAADILHSTTTTRATRAQASRHTGTSSARLWQFENRTQENRRAASKS